jgi:hypothetical protein
LLDRRRYKAGKVHPSVKPLSMKSYLNAITFARLTSQSLEKHGMRELMKYLG